MLDPKEMKGSVVILLSRSGSSSSKREMEGSVVIQLSRSGSSSKREMEGSVVILLLVTSEFSNYEVKISPTWILLLAHEEMVASFRELVFSPGIADHNESHSFRSIGCADDEELLRKFVALMVILFGLLLQCNFLSCAKCTRELCENIPSFREK